MTTENLTHAYRVAAGEGLENVWWKTGRLTVKAGGAQTGNSFSQMETDDPRGTATPMHIHHGEDETYYVLEGHVTVVVDGEQIKLREGDFGLAPRGVVHAYVVRSARARMLVTMSPAGLEQLFVELGVPVSGSEPPAGEVMPPIDEMARRFGAYGCEIVGLPPSLEDAA